MQFKFGALWRRIRERPNKGLDLLNRFAKQRSGAIAIEFLMLALPFLVLVFAILESCISFAAQQVMSNVADDVARELRTGQVRTLTKQQLRDKICHRLEIVVAKDCPGLLFDLRQFDSFAEAAKLRTKFTDDNDIDASDFNVVVSDSAKKSNTLRVYYKWPVITDLMRSSMSNLKDGKTMHFASVTWQNEPFAD